MSDKTYPIEFRPFTKSGKADGESSTGELVFFDDGKMNLTFTEGALAPFDTTENYEKSCANSLLGSVYTVCPNPSGVQFLNLAALKGIQLTAGVAIINNQPGLLFRSV